MRARGPAEHAGKARATGAIGAAGRAADHRLAGPGSFHGASRVSPASLCGAVRAEADFVGGEMGLPAGSTLGDIGCGPGRHLPHWRRLGLRPLGADLSPGFRPPLVADALRLPLADASVDAAVALCGVAGAVPLGPLLAELKRVARRVVVVAAFHLAFARRHLGLRSTWVRETVSVPDGEGGWAWFLHTHECYQPAELPGVVYGVEPGRYARRAPSPDLPELLAVWQLGGR